MWRERHGVRARGMAEEQEAAEEKHERERTRERAESGMRDALAELAPEVPFDVEVRVGRPATEIVAFTELPGVDLVVMGTRGQTGVRRLVFGSTAEEVARLSSAPVMVVKTAPAASAPAGSEPALEPSAAPR